MAEGEVNPGEGEGTPPGEGQGGQPVQAFNIEAVPEYAREWDEVKNFADKPDEFWKWADNIRSYAGRAIRLPGEDAGEEARAEARQKIMEHFDDVVMKPRNDEERAAFFKSLGMPDEPGAYQLDEIEGFHPDEKALGALQAHAHKAGLTQDQFKEFVASLAAEEVEANSQRSEQRNSDMTALRQEWGAAFDDRVDAVRGFLSQMGAPESIVAAEKADAFTASDYKWFHDMRERMGVGEGTPAGENGGQPARMTPAEAQAKIDEIRSNPEHPYNNTTASHDARVRARQQMQALYEMLPGGQGVVS